MAFLNKNWYRILLFFSFSVPFYAVAIAVSVSGVIGIFFGVFPARSASKMDPIEALRYE
ncbi:MAG: ABC efflux pump, inner membrane subunit [Candidatus Nomurabacteria bacterium GW2011_GWA1_40_8]|nr:MAG: ABC efflux pump, inner membrane subunit [Candidatus Nomurabacteria bacterium GW2011_GWA1_40_8]